MTEEGGDSNHIRSTYDEIDEEDEVFSSGQVPGTTPSIPGMFQNLFPMASGQFAALPVMPVQAMTQQATRHARRVYVGGLSPTANEQSVATYFSHVMSAIGGNTAGPGDAVVNVYMALDGIIFTFVEMRYVEEASNEMALDGIIFEVFFTAFNLAV
ncbi:splicing factor U2af large subunit B isoform X3 [Tanacetum coccineum]